LRIFERKKGVTNEEKNPVVRCVVDTGANGGGDSVLRQF
jgi:hypothetical protein